MNLKKFGTMSIRQSIQAKSCSGGSFWFDMRLLACFVAVAAVLPLRALDLASFLQEGDLTIEGSEGWLFFQREFEHLLAGEFWGDRAAEVSAASRVEWADPLPAILDFQRQLKERGVYLLLVPVPAKVSIYPGHLDAGFAGQDERWHNYHKEFYSLLADHGIDVLDLYEPFKAWTEEHEELLYCRTDTHWSGHGVALAAQEISQRIRERIGAPQEKRLTLNSAWEERIIRGDLVGERGLEESVAVKRVGHGDNLAMVEVAPDSPLILLGDSHNLVFHDGGDLHGRQAGLPDLLALELGTAVDLVAVRGSGATPARINLFRRAQRDPGYWDGKKVVVWCFSVREFTQADGWREVPIAR